MDRPEITFGRFCLDLKQRRLARDGMYIPLVPRALDVLCVLASAKGELVTKSELMHRVWSGVSVEENNIQVHISALRKALDDGNGQVHLLTVPGRGYRLLGLGSSGATEPAECIPAKMTSIAVLPFHNNSGDADQDYFAEGMVDEIVTGLSRIKWLSVISRRSTYQYKGAENVAEIAQTFEVRYIVSGRVRKFGERIRISAQLTDAATNGCLWAEHYDVILNDVFTVQDEITMRIVGVIEPSLWKAEIDRIKRQRPANLTAYDLVLRSLPLVLGHIPGVSQEAIPLLREALNLQPDYAAAHAFLARCFHHRYARGGLGQEDRAGAIKHARAAIAYGSDDATALAIAAHVIAMNEHDTDTALTTFDRALELSGSNVFALSFSSVVLAWMGNFQVATERAERAIRLNPYDVYNFRAHHALAIVQFCEQRYDQAAKSARSAVHANPRFSIAYAILAATLVCANRPTEATAAAQRVLELEPTFTICGVQLVAGELHPPVFQRFVPTWRSLGLPD